MNYTPDAVGPLAGVRVVDISRLVAGNQVSSLLADFGAEVLKIEDPGTGDPLRDWKAKGISAHWKVHARSKKSVTLNLRDAEAKALLLRLVEGAAIFIENFRVGALERMGLGPEVLLARNPKLVIVRVSGWGQTGPYRERPGFGTLVEGMSGFAAKNGYPDKPPALPNMALADMTAGLYGAFAVMTALREVELKGGDGQVIDLSLLEPLHAILGADAALHQINGTSLTRSGNRSVSSAPRNVYETSDGKWLAVSGSMQAMALRIFRAIGRADMCDDPRYSTNAARLQHVEEVDRIVGDAIKARTLDENMALFSANDVTAGPVYDAGQFRADPHVREREALVEMPDEEMGVLPMHNIIPRLSRTPGAIRTPAPTVGQHTAEILGELGVTAADLDRLKAAGAI